MKGLRREGETLVSLAVLGKKLLDNKSLESKKMFFIKFPGFQNKIVNMLNTF